MAKNHKGLFQIADPAFIQAGCDTKDNTRVALREVPEHVQIHRDAILGREITPDIQEVKLGKLVVGFLVKNREAMKQQMAIMSSIAEFPPYKGTYTFEWKTWQKNGKYNGFF